MISKPSKNKQSKRWHITREVFDTLLEAKVLIKRWRKAYNTVRPHSSQGYRPPEPEATQPCSVAEA